MDPTNPEDRRVPDDLSPPSLLIVDDEEEVCELLSAYLRPQGYRIRISRTGTGAMEALREASPDVVILDLHLPQVPGEEIMRHVRENHPETEVIIITGFASLDSALAAIKMGAFDYIVKPFKLGEIGISVRNALERIGLRKENRILRGQVGELLSRLGEDGESRPLAATIRFEDDAGVGRPGDLRGSPLALYGHAWGRNPRSDS